jgi:hypothetical protein
MNWLALYINNSTINIISDIEEQRAGAYNFLFTQIVACHRIYM